MDDLIKYYQAILESSNKYGITYEERVHQEIIGTLARLIALDCAHNAINYHWKFLENIDWNKYFSTPQRIAKFRKNLYRAFETLAESWGETNNYLQILSKFENEVVKNN